MNSAVSRRPTRPRDFGVAEERRVHVGSHRSKAVVDEEMRTVDEAGLVAGEKERRVCDFLRLANAALLNGKAGVRHVDTKLVERVDLAQSVRRTHESRTDGIAADVLVAILHGD